MEISAAEELYNRSKHRTGYKGIYQVYIKRIIDLIDSSVCNTANGTNRHRSKIL